ncbi:FAD:protein FMN transferase [Thiocystis violascens]|uniref:FAD:protein FMN transferase n=1 Tax=Thiocystis violascens (strain ATCC 17096 / DSM 198 / 6111) TaxID=765911 RepID=I3Y9X9_THIV6|nr:FAD:protein FMN transferase ApbE [Thiocystis violascens]AFL73797.1 membrane-associated lipoprotein involved in thiamine biosynthesis [Thiocystis violascens DSM 198]
MIRKNLSMGRRHGWLPFALFVAALLLPLAGCDKRADALIEIGGPTMGTYYSVKIARPPASMTAETLKPDVEVVLDQVIAEISTYDETSELSRLNRNPSTDWIPISSNLYDVIAEGQRIALLTDGAFDITIGPLVNLWGFGPEQRPDALPSSEEIQVARARVGWQKLDVRATPPAVRKARADLYIDLSALGEGVGADRVSALLEARGVADYMIAVAGAIRAKGRNAKGQPWAIAIEEPMPDLRSVHRVIPVSDRALSTSGDYRNFFERDGKRYSHEIDPMTGAPVERNLGSVTVIGESGMVVDGLATALMVMGEARGQAFAEARGLAAFFIVREGETLRGFGTPAFQGYLDR